MRHGGPVSSEAGERRVRRGPRLDPPGTNHRRKRDGDAAASSIASARFVIGWNRREPGPAHTWRKRQVTNEGCVQGLRLTPLLRGAPDRARIRDVMLPSGTAAECVLPSLEASTQVGQPLRRGCH